MNFRIVMDSPCETSALILAQQLASSLKAIILLVRAKEATVRITSKGQVTIPREIRQRAGLLPNTEVEFELDGRAVRIVKARTGKKPGRGELLLARLRGRGDVAMSTDEIMALTRAR